MKKLKFVKETTKAPCPDCQGTGLSHLFRCQSIEKFSGEQCTKQAKEYFIEMTNGVETHYLYFCGYHAPSFRRQYLKEETNE